MHGGNGESVCLGISLSFLFWEEVDLQGLSKCDIRATFYQAEGQTLSNCRRSVGEGPDSKVFLVCVLVNDWNPESALSG